MKSKKVVFVAAAILASLSLATTGMSANVRAASSDHLPAMGTKANVSFDRYSLMIDGHRTPIFSGEAEYWRLPSPSLYQDVLQKMKDNGFNAVTIYFDWGYHSPNSNTFNFEDVHNVDKLLSTAEKVGLYVIARPGPYINAETDAGGFPGWMLSQKMRARTNDPTYTKDYMDWLSHIDPIIAKHQITNGGNVILYQVENEYFGNNSKYMQDIIDKVHADGINVPTFHNAYAHRRDWINGEGAPDMYAYDNYPHLGKGFPTFYNDPHSLGYATKNPIFIAEYGGGWYDSWHGQGYDNVRKDKDAGTQNIQDKSAIGEGAKIISFYMTYGGSNPGYSAFPLVYSSYDYGAAIHEDRIFGKKMAQQKKIAYMMDAVEPIDKADTVSDKPLAKYPNVRCIEMENKDDGTQFYVVRHENTASTTNETFSLPIHSQDINQEVPANINGKTAKLILAHYNFGNNEKLIYSTNELFTDYSNGKTDTAVFYSKSGDDNQTVFHFDQEPKVKVLSGSVDSKWDAAKKTLTFHNNFKGLAQVEVTKADGQKFNLIFGTDDDMDNLWLQKTSAGKVLVNGSYFVSGASVNGDSLNIEGETDKDTNISVLAPAGINQLSWNHQALTTTKDNNLLKASISGPDKSKVQIPALTNWKEKDADPESQLHFDDSQWTKADKKETASIDKIQTPTSLLGDDYGFHYGDVWLRGHFKATGKETGIKLNGKTANYGVYSVWLNGRFLGTEVNWRRDAKEKTFSFRNSDLRRNSDNVISILISNMGHDEDFYSNDSYRSARGITEASLQGADKGESINWKIQGAKDKENPKDTVRGIYNVGGLYGERKGWYLPGMDDSSWKSVGSNLNSNQAGVKWYRTSFNLNLPQNYDVPISLEFNDPTFMQADDAGQYRVYIYINGWNYGQYINEAGPEKKFYLPAGLLNQDGHNTLALAIWKEDNEPMTLNSVQLVADGIFKTDKTIQNVKAPSYSDLFGSQGGNSGNTGNNSGNTSASTNGNAGTQNGNQSGQQAGNTNQSSSGSISTTAPHATAQTKRIRLTHNALIYNKKGRVRSLKSLKKGKYITALHNGHAYTIKGKKFYQIGANKYVKIANTVSGRYVAYKKARKILVLGKKGTKVTTYSAQGKADGHVLAGKTYKVSGYRKNVWTKKSKKGVKAYKLSGKHQYVLSSKARLLK